MNKKIVWTMIGLISLLFSYCGSSPGSMVPLPDAALDSDSGSASSDAGTGGFSGDGGANDAGAPVIPGIAGEPCWNPDIFSNSHPNAGLPNCEKGLKCIGDEDEAWCTEKCSLTGEYHSAGGGLEGWCCGELTNPCAPGRFWLPDTMSFHCIPRKAQLDEPCSTDSTWTGQELFRCAPLCDGAELLHHTVCIQDGGQTFCTFPCSASNEDECLGEAPFQDGCCGKIGQGFWCMSSDRC